MKGTKKIKITKLSKQQRNYSMNTHSHGTKNQKKKKQQIVQRNRERIALGRIWNVLVFLLFGRKDKKKKIIENNSLNETPKQRNKENVKTSKDNEQNIEKQKKTKIHTNTIYPNCREILFSVFTSL